MSTKLPDVVSRYFERDGDRDIESIVGLFAEDATVIDEGEERHGTAEIRAWQTGAASKYTYTTEITSTEALGADRYLVTGRLTGNFPGGTADLRWDFSIAGQQITRLIIAPWAHTHRTKRAQFKKTTNPFGAPERAHPSRPAATHRALRSLAGATGGKWQRPENGSNTPIGNGWQPTATVSLVRRKSTVRVRQSAY